MGNQSLDHDGYMRRCIELARRARANGDSPVGALVVRDDAIVAEGIEAVNARRDVTAHAEIETIRAACARLASLSLAGCTLYTSVEPCVMCAWAIRLARVERLVTGAPEPGGSPALNGWAVVTNPGLLPNHPPPAVLRGVLIAECRDAGGA